MPKKTSSPTSKPQPTAPPDTKALQLVNDRFTRSRSDRNVHQDGVWERSYKNWKGELDSTQYPWRSKLFIPWSFTVVESIIPKVFARDPKWRALARSPDFPVDGPQTVQDLLTYQWKRMGMRLKMYDYIKDSLMFCKGYAKLTWNFKTKTKTFMEPVVGEDDKIDFVKTVKSEIEHDDPMCEIIDPADIYVDPDATPGCMSYLIHRKTVEKSVLKDNPNYKNVGKIKSSNYADQYLDSYKPKDTTPQKDKHKDLVEILEYWEDDRLIVVANRSVVLRDSPNPYNHKMIPFVELDDYRDPHSYYGQSELSVIDPLQREVNAIRNQRRDYDNLALNPVILHIPGTLRNPNSAVMAPGAVWQVTDLNSIAPFQLPLLQGASTDIETQTAQDIKMTVALDEIGIGLLPDNPQRRSATEVVTAQTMAGKRFAIKIALLEEAVKKMGQMVFALNQQFLDQERLIQIVGERSAQEWVQLGPEDVRGDYFIDVEVGSMLPKDEIAARREAIELLQYITPIISPVIQTNPSIILPIIRMVLDTFELPGKQEILDELNSALGSAAQSLQEQNLAQNAATEAGAVSDIAGAVQAPQDLQGERSNQEAEALLAGQMPLQ